MMIGPMKRKMITTGVISFVLPTILFVVIFGMYSSKQKEEIARLNIEKEVIDRYVFSGDLPVDHIIKTNDIKMVGVKAVSAPQDSFEAGSIEKIVGRKLKIAAFDKTIITENMFYKEEDNVTNDLRKKEFNMIALPSDLVEGDYIDIRIMFPTGEDFLVVVGKEVKQVGTNADSNTIFLELTEEELVKLSGAIIESYIADSVYLYAVKYVNNYQQLFKEKHVDYVEKYEVALEEMISGDYALAYAEALAQAKPIEDDSGDIVRDKNNAPVMPEIKVDRKTAADYTVEEIALRAGISTEIAREIRTAFASGDETLLKYYSNQTVVVSDLLTPNYPIREEVYALINSNPNILETLKAKYNIEELEAQRQTLVNTSIFDENIYTGEITENKGALSSVASKLDTEINLQKTERKEYLQNLIRSNLASGK